VTGVAKQPDPDAQSNGSEKLIEKCSYLPTKMMWCAILLEPQLSSGAERNNFWKLIFQETEVALGCQALFTYKRPDGLASNNTAPNSNRKTVPEMFLLLLSNSSGKFKMPIYMYWNFSSRIKHRITSLSYAYRIAGHLYKKLLLPAT